MCEIKTPPIWQNSVQKWMKKLVSLLLFFMTLVKLKRIKICEINDKIIIDFSDNPVKTCITMTQPEVVIQQEMVSKWLDGSKKANSKLRLRKPGRTLFLNDKNNELCNQMHRKTTR